jgi:PAS domain S-box-containing protein
MRIEARANTLPISTIYLLIAGVWIFSTLFLFSERLIDAETSRRLEYLLCYGGLLLTGGFLFFLIRNTENSLVLSQGALHRVNRALKARSDCSQILVRADNEDGLMVDVCRIIVESGGYRLAWVGFADNDPGRTVRPVAQWGYENGYLNSIRISWGDNEFGRGPTGHAIRSGEPNVAQHIQTDPKWAPWREKALQLGYASSLSLPLVMDTQVFGALVIFAGEPDAFGGRECEFLQGLADDLSYGIATVRMRREKERSRNERKLLATIVEQESDGVLTFDTAGTIQYVNPAFEAISGYGREELVGRNVQNIEKNGPIRSFFQVMTDALNLGSRFERLVNRRNDGTLYDIEAKISPVCGPSGTTAYVAVVRDLTYEVQLERQLCQAQKMEAVATLAGGIAHDFNNILAAVITNTEMALDDAPEGTPLREHLAIVLKAGFRAKSLVRQILTLSYQKEQERQPVRIELIVRECLKLLRASLPTTIDIPVHRSACVGLVHADTSQIHQVIMNLCTNAADAMQERGGRLDISLTEAELTADDPMQLPPGRYVCLTVTDTGHGMERKTIERIFDPFFTTKEPGRGTGLGLSVVHAIVRSHGGAISVSSEPGKGTAFRVFLPRIEAEAEGEKEYPATPPPPGGNECILFLDDEADIVSSNQKMLENLGYEVVAGTSSPEALAVFRSQPDRFDLVITDQTMPHLTGERLALEILAVRPDIPIILCTGLGSFSQSGVTEKMAKTIGIREVVMKPTERSEMARIIRRVLDESVRSQGVRE